MEGPKRDAADDSSSRGSCGRRGRIVSLGARITRVHSGAHSARLLGGELNPWQTTLRPLRRPTRPRTKGPRATEGPDERASRATGETPGNRREPGRVTAAPGNRRRRSLAGLGPLGSWQSELTVSFGTRGFVGLALRSGAPDESPPGVELRASERGNPDRANWPGRLLQHLSPRWSGDWRNAPSNAARACCNYLRVGATAVRPLGRIAGRRGTGLRARAFAGSTSRGTLRGESQSCAPSSDGVRTGAPLSGGALDGQAPPSGGVGPG